MEDQSVIVDGCKIFGTPWTPRFGDRFVAFTEELESSALWRKWQAIPKGTDVLVTHGPPLGRRDLTKFGVRAGCRGDCFFWFISFFLSIWVCSSRSDFSCWFVCRESEGEGGEGGGWMTHLLRIMCS